MQEGQRVHAEKREKTGPAGTDPDGGGGPQLGALDTLPAPHPRALCSRGLRAERTVRSVAVVTGAVAPSAAAASVAIVTGAVAASTAAASCREKVGGGFSR